MGNGQQRRDVASEPATRNGDNTTSPTSTYSDVLQVPGDWSLAENKNRKKRAANKQRQQQERVQRKPADKRTLQGCVREKGTQLYLEHIQIRVDDTDEGITRMVREHGQFNGVRVMSAYVIHNRVCADVVGCKITVPASQEEKAMSPDFWAEDISCRIWKNRGPRGKQQQRHKQNQQTRPYNEDNSETVPRRNQGGGDERYGRDSRSTRPREWHYTSPIKSGVTEVAMLMCTIDGTDNTRIRTIVTRTMTGGKTLRIAGVKAARETIMVIDSVIDNVNHTHNASKS